jgi:hypothetical protein
MINDRLISGSTSTMWEEGNWYGDGDRVSDGNYCGVRCNSNNYNNNNDHNITSVG